MAKTKPADPVLVIGLGRFGGAVAEALVGLGHEVLAIDQNAERVQKWSGRLTSVAQADTTSEEALRQLGAADFARAVVAIGTDVEASILTVGVLVDIAIPCIWAKALTKPHGRILARVGATKVIYPEHDMGERVAHMVTGRMIDYIEFDEGFALVETPPPKYVIGKTLGESGIRHDHGVTVVCIKAKGDGFTYATKDSLISGESILIVAGETALVERFANLA